MKNEEQFNAKRIKIKIIEFTIMTKRDHLLVTIVLALFTAKASACAGDASNSCNGMANTCTSDGLCVVNTSTGSCCLLSAPYGWNNCISDQNADACVIRSVSTYAVDDSVAVSSVVTVPSPSPTLSSSVVSSTSTTSESCHKIEIGLIFDEFPEETKWEITQGRRNSIESENAVVVKTSPYYDPDNGYVEASEKHIVCLPQGKYTFTIMDRNEDGMCCSNGEGRYSVIFKETGEIITHGSNFGQYESITFLLPYEAPPLTDADKDGVEDRTKNVFPPMILSEDGLPVATCDNEFSLHLETDDYGVETTWELRKRSTTGNYEDGKVVASGGPYASSFTYDVSYCLYPGSYTYVFYDWGCDGLTGEEMTGSYTLKANGVEVHTGGTTMNKYWEEVNLEFTNEIVTSNSSIRTKSMVTFWSIIVSVVAVTWL